jgi:hypothetical protein
LWYHLKSIIPHHAFIPETADGRHFVPMTITSWNWVCFTFIPALYIIIYATKGVFMNEIIFIVEDAPEGGFIARALRESIFTEADSLQELHDAIRDAVHCHFDEGKCPAIIRLHFVREEVIAA